jgi:hypothetical protein
MVYNGDVDEPKQLIHAILIADLSPTQLSTIQEQFGLGANLLSPYPTQQLFITDKRSWAPLSHLEIWHNTPHHDDEPGYFPLIIIDAETPRDNAVWFIDSIAMQEDVDNGEAESLNTLYKVRMELANIPISYVNFEIANTDIREAMSNAGIPWLVPEEFTQEKPYSVGFDYVKNRYVNPTLVIAEPGEIEESREWEILKTFLPSPEVVYRLKEHVAQENGLTANWAVGSDRKDDRFPEGSKILQVNYDPAIAVPRYEKPEGSL